MKTWTENEVGRLNAEYEAKDAMALLRWGIETFTSKITLASSFGAEDAALIDMGLKVSRSLRIFSLDTGRLNEETYEVMDAIRRRYGIQIHLFFPEDHRVEELVRTKGLFSFRESVENRIECCHIRKVEPLKRALQGYEAWITGLRRDQAMTRKHIAKIESDPLHQGILKLNPLADWSEEKVWDYIRKNNVPYNRLHDQGYRSIGCAPCTRAVQPGEDVRAGRWWWERPEHKECGIHVAGPSSDR